MSPFRQGIAGLGQNGLARQQGMNSFATGERRYGLSARRGPNTGMTLDKSGYQERDRRAAIRKQLMLRKLQAGQSGRPLSGDAMRPIERL